MHGAVPDMSLDKEGSVIWGGSPVRDRMKTLYTLCPVVRVEGLLKGWYCGFG